MGVSIDDIVYDKSADRLAIHFSGDDADLKKVETATSALGPATATREWDTPPFTAKFKAGVQLFSSTSPPYLEVSLEKVSEIFPQPWAMGGFETPDFQALIWYLLSFMRDIDDNFEKEHQLASLTVHHPLLELQAKGDEGKPIVAVNVTHVASPNIAAALLLSFKYEALRAIESKKLQGLNGIDLDSPIDMDNLDVTDYSNPDSRFGGFGSYLPCFFDDTPPTSCKDVAIELEGEKTFPPNQSSQALIEAQNLAAQVEKLFGIRNIKQPARTKP